MESIEEQDDMSNKHKNVYYLQNYTPNNYYPQKYSNLPYENMNNPNQYQQIKNQKEIQAITKIFNIDNPNNIQDFINNNQQIIKLEENSYNIIHKDKDISENNNIIVNSSFSKDNDLDNNTSNNKFQTGRWSPKEHQKFIEGILRYGNEWKNVQNIIKTRSSTQARSHAQKFFLRLRKIIHQDSISSQEKIFKYIIGQYDKNEYNFKLSPEQKDKLMSVIRSNLRAEENNYKSAKDILKSESGLDELNEDEEEDNLGYNNQPENENLGLQKKMSCDLEINKKRKITFCSRKRNSSNDMSFNSNCNKIFDIKKDIHNKRSIDLVNEKNFNSNNSQQKIDKEKNDNTNKTKNIIFNPNPNFIVNKNIINNGFANKDNLTNNQADMNNIKGKNTKIIIHNNIYNFFISEENNNKPDANRNNNNYNANNKNKLNNNYQSDNPKTVIFKTDFKTPMKSQLPNNQNNNPNENEYTHYNINYIVHNKNFFPDNVHNNFNQENINNNNNSNNHNNNNNNNNNNNSNNNCNNRTNEPEQSNNPFDLKFDISNNDKKIQEGYFNNNNENNERSQTLSDKEKDYTFINEQ